MASSVCSYMRSAMHSTFRSELLMNVLNGGCEALVLDPSVGKIVAGVTSAVSGYMLVKRSKRPVTLISGLGLITLGAYCVGSGGYELAKRIMGLDCTTGLYANCKYFSGAKTEDAPELERVITKLRTCPEADSLLQGAGASFIMQPPECTRSDGFLTASKVGFLRRGDEAERQVSRAVSVLCNAKHTFDDIQELCRATKTEKIDFPKFEERIAYFLWKKAQCHDDVMQACQKSSGWTFNLNSTLCDSFGSYWKKFKLSSEYGETSAKWHKTFDSLVVDGQSENSFY